MVFLWVSVTESQPPDETHVELIRKSGGAKMIIGFCSFDFRFDNVNARHPIVPH